MYVPVVWEEGVPAISAVFELKAIVTPEGNPLAEALNVSPQLELKVPDISTIEAPNTMVWSVFAGAAPDELEMVQLDVFVVEVLVVLS